MVLFHWASVFLVGFSVLVLQTDSQGKNSEFLTNEKECIENFSYLVGSVSTSKLYVIQELVIAFAGCNCSLFSVSFRGFFETLSATSLFPVLLVIRKNYNIARALVLSNSYCAIMNKI